MATGITLKEWFEKNVPPAVRDGISKMEDVESWIEDGNDDPFEMLARFVTHEDKKNLKTLIADRDMPEFVRILAFVRTGKSLYLMNLFNQCQAGLSGDVLKTCQDSNVEGGHIEAESKVILARFKLLTLMELYERIFGPEHRKDVLTILESLKEKGVDYA